MNEIDDAADRAFDVWSKTEFRTLKTEVPYVSTTVTGDRALRLDEWIPKYEPILEDDYFKCFDGPDKRDDWGDSMGMTRSPEPETLRSFLKRNCLKLVKKQSVRDSRPKKSSTDEKNPFRAYYAKYVSTDLEIERAKNKLEIRWSAAKSEAKSVNKDYGTLKSTRYEFSKSMGIGIAFGGSLDDGPLRTNDEWYNLAKTAEMGKYLVGIGRALGVQRDEYEAMEVSRPAKEDIDYPAEYEYRADRDAIRTLVRKRIRPHWNEPILADASSPKRERALPAIRDPAIPISGIVAHTSSPVLIPTPRPPRPPPTPRVPTPRSASSLEPNKENVSPSVSSAFTSASLPASLPPRAPSPPIVSSPPIVQKEVPSVPESLIVPPIVQKEVPSVPESLIVQKKVKGERKKNKPTNVPVVQNENLITVTTKHAVSDNSNHPVHDEVQRLQEFTKALPTPPIPVKQVVKFPTANVEDDGSREEKEDVVEVNKNIELHDERTSGVGTAEFMAKLGM